MGNDQEDIRKIRERNQVGVSIDTNKKGVSMKEMAQIVKDLKAELTLLGDAMAEYETMDVETEDELITQGWCEALNFAIRKIEEAMKKSQEDSVKNIRNFLSPEEA